MSGHELFLNCFRLRFYPESVELPCCDFPTQEAAIAALRAQYRDQQAAWCHTNAECLRLFFIAGPDVPENTQRKTLDPILCSTGFQKLAIFSLSQHFSRKNLSVDTNRSETHVWAPTPFHSDSDLSIYRGITFKVQRPFDSQPNDFILVAKLRAFSFFETSLNTPFFREIAEGKPVIYRPQSKEHRGNDLSRYVGRYLGKVVRVFANDHADVLCKDGESRNILLQDLVFEASPAVIRDYEAKRKQPPKDSAWHATQRATFVLNRSGRRNTSVLKDRLNAIRSFLASNSPDSLYIPLGGYADGSITIDLAPLTASIGPYV